MFYHVMASRFALRCHSLCRLQRSNQRGKLQIPSNVIVFGTNLAPRPGKLYWKQLGIDRRFVSRATSDSSNSDENRDNQDEVSTNQKEVGYEFGNPVSKFQRMTSSLPPAFLAIKRNAGNNIWIGLCIVTSLLIVAIRIHVIRRSRQRRPPGSVADLVRRGQLRSDRRGISKPLKYEDPFNNPFVKTGKSSSTIEMCGKVYKLAPVTLTADEQAVHQKRRSRAYQWKRPKVFLKEGEPIPPDVDPDTVRWIPANHPFATTASDIDEDLAQNNVYQKHGVPFRIRAEHKALQRKLEALQIEEKFDNLGIDDRNARDFQRPLKFGLKSDETAVQGSPQNRTVESNPSQQDSPLSFPGSNSEEAQEP